MNKINRTFTVSEIGKAASFTQIVLPTSDPVEVVDLTTRMVLQIKVSEVSIYRHTLHFQGKNFKIMNVQDSR